MACNSKLVLIVCLYSTAFKFLRELLAELFNPGMKIFRLAIIQEIGVASMSAEDFTRMLDRAEILLGAGGDFARVSQHPAGV